MAEETKYRVETPEDDEEPEKKGFLRPLPSAPKSVASDGSSPMTTFLGITMREKVRDVIVLLLIPALVAIIDVNIYASVMIGTLPDSTIYLFAVPVIAAIPVGLTAGNTSQALIGALITSVFFSITLLLFLIGPGIISPEIEIGSFFISGMVLTSIYVLMIILASLLGSLVGALAREF
ncbi:MAG: hypothetical protein ACTSQZ_07175, partial [Candidatus Thorarchaeota archaeon]